MHSQTLLASMLRIFLDVHKDGWYLRLWILTIYVHKILNCNVFETKGKVTAWGEIG